MKVPILEGRGPWLWRPLPRHLNPLRGVEERNEQEGLTGRFLKDLRRDRLMIGFPKSLKGELLTFLFLCKYLSWIGSLESLFDEIACFLFQICTKTKKMAIEGLPQGKTH